MSSSTNFLKNRLEDLRQKFPSEKIDCLLVSNAANRYYLSGWFGDIESGYLLITKQNAFVITDSRYTEEAAKRAQGFIVAEYGKKESFWQDLFKKAAVKRVGFEAKDLTVFGLNNFRRLVKNVSWVATEGLVEDLRATKDAKEINLLKKSIAIADSSFEFILKNIKVGQTEKEVAFEIEKFMKMKGSEKNAWESFIVGSGKNSSMVHYSAGEKVIKKGDQVLIDWGCYFQGYACDISRVIFMGTPNSKQAQYYNWTLSAQEKGIEEVKLGYPTKNVDLAARNFLKEKTPFYFRHAVGHGVGLEVHEKPSVNEKTKEVFKEGNVVTVEPGIYEPGWGGIRIEDMVLVEKNKTSVLTKAPKTLSAVIV